jgi:uncharacterized protein YbjT (DUF2867 family)
MKPDTKELSMILITGSTGLTGSAVVREFARNGHAARALIRDPAKTRLWGNASGIDAVRGDLLAPATLAPALDGIDTVVLISSANHDMVDAQRNLIDAAVAAGVERIVKISGLGPDPASEFRFARYHAQVEQHLRQAPVRWTLLRPSQFMQVYYREVATMLADGTLAQPLGTSRLAPIDIADVAAITYRTATESGHDSAIYEMTGPEALSMAEVCAILSGVVGREIRYVDLPPEEKRRRLVAAGVAPHFADDLDALFRLRREGGPESRVRTEVFDKLGIRPTPFAEFARGSAEIFRGTSTADQLWASGWQKAQA